MTVKWLVLILVATFSVALIIGVVGVTVEWWLSEDDKLHRAAGGVTLVTEPAEVNLASEHQIRFRVHIANSGDEPVKAWALDLGQELYLVKAQPQELLYHKGHAKGKHGNVLIYATKIDPGGSLRIDLTLRVLFDSQGSFEPNPELRLSYARSARDAQTLAITDLRKFQDTFVTFPVAITTIHIEQ